MDNPCPFCLKAENFTPGEVMDFEPLNPVTPGHLLFVPTVHVPDIGFDPRVSAGVMHAVALYVHYIGDCNVITSKGPNATQTVPHFHVHVVPRHAGDGLPLPWTPQQQAAYPPCMAHMEVQHRDRKRPWCNSCGWNRGQGAVAPAKIAEPR